MAQTGSLKPNLRQTDIEQAHLALLETADAKSFCIVRADESPIRPHHRSKEPRRPP